MPTFPRRPSRTRACFVALALCTLAASFLGLSTGAIRVPARELWEILLDPTVRNTTHASVIWDLRAPRVLLAILVGASLATAGAAMQGLFRNPLADPGLVGVSSGAALAAVAAIVFASSVTLDQRLIPFMTPAASFAGGLFAAWLAARLACAGGQTRTATLLLAGLAVNAIAGAGIGLLTQISGDAALREVTFWLFGSLSKSGWAELAIGAPLLLIVLFLLPRDARALDALLLGEAEAEHLGIDVEALKRRVTLLVVLAVAVSVALAGVIGFIGLVVPHLLRLYLGPEHRGLLPSAAIGGAALLASADLAARSWLAPAELPVGILTALIGGPFFLGLLIQMRGRIESW